jgi:hypothetical protein
MFNVLSSTMLGIIVSNNSMTQASKFFLSILLGLGVYKVLLQWMKV